MPSDDQPLTDDELDELDRFLVEAEGLEDPMDVSMLDGYFAALLSGPNTIMPSEWMRWVWDLERGEGSPEFKSSKQANRIMRLMMRHMNDVTLTLLNEPEHYEPILIESPGADGPVLVIDEWCEGFMKGVALDAQGWSPLASEHPDWMSTMELYGTPAGWERLERAAPSIDEHQARARGLGDVVRNIHAYFMVGRRARADGGSAFKPVDPVRAPPKVGRNEPCPCGSGKKFKHCHGAGPQTVH